MKYGQKNLAMKINQFISVNVKSNLIGKESSDLISKVNFKVVSQIQERVILIVDCLVDDFELF